MLPTFSGFKSIDLLPPALPEPIEVEFTFIGGSLDGTKHTATVKCEVDSSMKLYIKSEVYRYSENNTFTYEGEREDNAHQEEVRST
jgi:hypothetical protein